MTDSKRLRDMSGYTLRRWLELTGVSQMELSMRLRAIRRHPTQPTANAVSHWACGRQVPTHDMRIFLEVATEGGVPLECWSSKRGRA